MICKKTAEFNRLNETYGVHDLNDQYHRRRLGTDTAPPTKAARPKPGACPTGWTWLQTSSVGHACAGRCYSVESDLGSSTDQEQRCVDRGAHLAAARTIAEHKLLARLAEKGGAMTWLGMLYAFPTEEDAEVERDFGWIRYDASVLFDGNFEMWAKEQPAAPPNSPLSTFLCVALDSSDNAAWTVRDCKDKFYGICERAALISPSGKECHRSSEEETGGVGETKKEERTKRDNLRGTGTTTIDLTSTIRDVETRTEKVALKATLGCAAGWHYFNGLSTGVAEKRGELAPRQVCFKVLQTAMSHHEAGAECRSVGIHLDNDDHVAHLATMYELCFRLDFNLL